MFIKQLKKTILFITGTRADFGKLKPLMLIIDKSDDFVCNIFCTGMHTLFRYDYTYEEIQKSGFSNIFLHINQTIRSSSDMDLVLSNTVQGLGLYVREFKPDLIVVHGDRIEALAGAIVGMLNNILVAHIEGGEISGTIDEIIRHSISKMSHLHFVSNFEAKKRLLQLGENDESIFVIGSPDIDLMLSKDLPSITKAKTRYGIEFSEYAIFCYHPVTTELSFLETNINIVIDAIKASGLNYIILYPNNDTGSDIILKCIKSVMNHKQFKVFSSIRFEHYLTLLRHSLAVVGNSSVGIHEAPVYGVPTINIGTRQNNRYTGKTIINVKEDKNMILNELKNLPNHVEPSFHFGKGESATQFIEKLRKTSFWKTSLQKQFNDLKK